MKANRIVAATLLVTLCFTMTACAAGNPDVLGVSNPTTPLAVSDGSTLSDSEPPIAYQNDYFGYKCVLPEDWYVLNDEEISEQIDETNEAFSDSESFKLIRKSLDDGASVTEFYAYSRNYSQTINIVLSKGKLLDLFLPIPVLLETAMLVSATALEDMGLTNISHKIEKVDFLGKENDALNIEGDIQSDTLYQVTFLLRKGFYLSTISVSGYDQDSLQSLLDYFQVIE